MEKLSITPSIVIEYLYCPRFIYFMKVLDIPQNEEKRYKVNQGREIHKFKELTNVDYLRKKINVVKKWKEQELYSEKYRIHGKVDEILEFEDGTMGVLDYKFAEFKEKVFSTYKTQLIMYSLMVENNFDKKVNKSYIVYTRSKNYIEEIKITEKDKQNIKQIIEKILKIIEKGYFPLGTSSQSKCSDCCYRNICVN
jgi:CRISPR-associated exonuclease Cas4